MKKYARILNNTVVEIILPMLDADDIEVPVEDRFHADFVNMLIDITNILPEPSEHWVCIDGVFSAPTTGISVDEQLLANEAAVQGVLDAKAKERGYASIVAACAYASTAVILGTDEVSLLREKFRVEGCALQLWMSSTWAVVHLAQQEAIDANDPCLVQADVIALIPAFSWPV